MSLLPLLIAGTALAADDPRAAVAATLAAWTEATDAKDADAVARVFHPQATQFVRLGGKEMTLATDAYLGMIRAGKIGGDTTTLTIHEVSIRPPLATALITRSSAAMIANDAVTLALHEGQWHITSASIDATLR